MAFDKVRSRFANGLPHTNFRIAVGQSYLEEPPETPAPLFAVRAFKTAIFGTPHPSQDDESNDEKRVVQSADVNAKEYFPQPQTLHGVSYNPGLSTEVNCKPKIEPLASPAKGILLTPGTAAARRKTVSFGGLVNNTASETKRELDQVQIMDGSSNDGQGLLVPEASRSQPRNQSSLTKTLFKAKLEASKKRLSGEVVQEKPTPSTLSVKSKDGVGVRTTSPEEPSNVAADATIDLSQPRSRSGQHWKAEYELYHKNSAREMKKIIKYGQNVKSYALKKDSEAASLGEKLEHELSKLAAMEAKVSKLAMQLASGRQGGLDRGANQVELMSDLAKQTALAVRYKQKADMYRKTIETNKTADLGGRGREESCDENKGKELSPKCLSTKEEPNEPYLELLSLRTELETFKENVKSTEGKAAKLEAENLTLKRSLARVKEEMSSYEKRRLVREQRLKNREIRLQQEKQDYERRLAETTSEYQRLLYRTDQHAKEPCVKDSLPKRNSDKSATIENVEGEFWEEGIFPKQLTPSDDGYKESVPTPPTRKRHQDNTSPESGTVWERPRNPLLRDTVMAPLDEAESKMVRLPNDDRKQLSQMSDVDIWTMGSLGNAVSDTSLSKALAQSSHFDLLRKETNDALQEIDQNSVLEPPTNNQTPARRLEISSGKWFSPKNTNKTTLAVSPASTSPGPPMSSAVRRMHKRRFDINSPRPSIVNLASGPAQQMSSLEDFQAAHGSAGRKVLVGGSREQRYSSVVSSSTRTSTITSARRRSALPADRAVAAKARLQRRSMEKQKMRETST